MGILVAVWNCLSALLGSLGHSWSPLGHSSGHAVPKNDEQAYHSALLIPDSNPLRLFFQHLLQLLLILLLSLLFFMNDEVVVVDDNVVIVVIVVMAVATLLQTQSLPK